MIYEQYAEAWDTQNADLLGSLCHPNLEMIMHFLIPFPNGTKDAVLYYIQKENGLMRKIETGSTPLNKG